MGLILWYPFTKNAKNYGSSNGNFSIQPDLTKGGPLGSYASFNSNAKIYLSKFLSTNFNISFYFLTAETDIDEFLIFNNQNLADIVYLEIKCVHKSGEYQLRFAMLSLNDLLNFYVHTISVNRWYHVVFIYQNREIKIYIDSILVKTYSPRNIEFSTTFTLGGLIRGSLYFCDFRFYDNSLDDYDIKRIYRGSAFDIVATERRGGIIYDHSGYLTYFPVSSEKDGMPLIASNNMVFTRNIICLSDGYTEFTILSVWFKPDWGYDGSEEVIFAYPNKHKMAMILNSKTHEISFSTNSKDSLSNLITIIASDDFINIIRDYETGEVFVNGKLIRPEFGNVLSGDIFEGPIIGGTNNSNFFTGQIKKITAYNNLDTQDIPLLYESEKKMLTEIENFYSASTLEYLVFNDLDYVSLSGWEPDLNKPAEIKIEIKFDIPKGALFGTHNLITNSRTGVRILGLEGRGDVVIGDNSCEPLYVEIEDNYLQCKFDLIFNNEHERITFVQYGEKNDSKTTEFYPGGNKFQTLYDTLNSPKEEIILGGFETFSFIGRLYYVNISFFVEGNVVFYKNFTPKEENNITGLTDGNTFYPLVSNH